TRWPRAPAPRGAATPARARRSSARTRPAPIRLARTPTARMRLAHLRVAGVALSWRSPALNDSSRAQTFPRVGGVPRGSGPAVAREATPGLGRGPGIACPGGTARPGGLARDGALLAVQLARHQPARPEQPRGDRGLAHAQGAGGLPVGEPED